MEIGRGKRGGKNQKSMSTVNEMGGPAASHLEDDHLPGVGGCLLHPGAFAAHQGLEGVQHAAVLELHGKASACPGAGRRLTILTVHRFAKVEMTLSNIPSSAFDGNSKNYLDDFIS
eukprot:scaffold154143_cov20-Prasinocladus_malaysianus.AAC.1